MSTATRLAYLGLLVIAAGCGSVARRPTLPDAFAAAQRGDVRQALEIYAAVAEQNPDTIEAAVAIDAAVELSGNRLLPPRRFSCSASATAKYEDAERLFHARDIQGAERAYGAALAECPENGTWWIHAGDAYFAAQDWPRAREFYLEGLRRDPWNRSGYRFLADLDMRLGDANGAYRNAVLAVVSDPTYEAGWFTLRQLTFQLGGRWNRERVVKPRIEVEDGKPKIVLNAQASRASGSAWMGYALLRWAMSNREPASAEAGGAETGGRLPAEEWARMSPLQRESWLMTEALQVYAGVVAANPGSESLFWATLERARSDGFLDEAIYLTAMDRDLAPTYSAFRDQQSARVIAFVTRLLAPLPIVPEIQP